MTKEQSFQKINEVFKTKPLIYFSREAERAIGLEKVLENYHICCVEDSYIVSELIKNNISVFCLEREISETEFKGINKSTANLLAHEKVTEWIKKMAKGSEFYALTFLPSNVVNFKIEKLGGILLNNPYELNLRFENKLVQADILESNGIKKPKYKNVQIDEVRYESLISEFGERFVIQTEKSHTGNGTFFINSAEEFNKIQKELSGNKVKFTEIIQGEACTINCCIYKNSLFIGPMQYQITGIPKIMGTNGVTIGNDFEYGTEILNKGQDQLVQNLVTEISKIGKMLNIEKYRGIFGIDFIVKDTEIFTIEINARQTANIPFQTKLELAQSNQIPQLALHIAEFLNLDLSEGTDIKLLYKHIPMLKGSQIFVRSLEDKFEFKKEYKSGVYRLQSDNSAMDWSKQDPSLKEAVISLDEEMDKPLIWKKDSYSIDNLEGGFLIVAQKTGSIKNKFDELVRFQFDSGSIVGGKLKPWILEMYSYFSKL